MPFLMLARHGESTHNRENRFTGWLDVSLTDTGKREAKAIAAKIAGYRIDTAYSSALRRTIESLNLVLEQLHLQKIPVVHSRELNERHYGDLQGLNKTETAEQFGDELVHTWRRSYTTAPPNGESLQDAGIRILAFFHARILRDIQGGLNVLVVAHGNTIRAILKNLDDLTDVEIMDVTIATGDVIVYEYDRSAAIVAKTIL
jgi:2,3-bisphosphoglycerate-dependent phosphoglycerate mutase